MKAEEDLGEGEETTQQRTRPENCAGAQDV